MLKRAALHGLSPSLETGSARDEAAVHGVHLAVELRSVVVGGVRREDEAERRRQGRDEGESPRPEPPHPSHEILHPETGLGHPGGDGP